MNKGRAMKIWQKVIIYILILAALMVTLYPPWVVESRSRSNVNFFLGHRFIFSRPFKIARIKLHDYLWSLAVVYILLALVVVEFVSMNRK